MSIPTPTPKVCTTGGQGLCHPVSRHLAPHSGMLHEHLLTEDMGLWAVHTEIPLKARRVLLSLSHGGEDPADTLSTCKATESVSQAHISPPEMKA